MKRPYLMSFLSAIALIISSVASSAYAITFKPPARNSAPTTATGGASRSSLFVPRQGKGAPTTATGGASRGNLFTPQGAPRQASGGASRGNLFTPQGAPRRTAGGASRVGAYYLNPSTVAATGPAALIGLMPASYYGTTLSERPTVMVYLPASNAKEAVFSIKDEVGHTHYQMTIPVANKSGIVKITLPEQAPSLVVGKNYQWFFALKINGQLSPSTPYVDGWIERIQPSAELVAAMQQRDLLAQAKALGENGVWYDCLATLAQIQASQVNNPTILKQWEELLTSVGLQEIAQAPLLGSVN